MSTADTLSRTEIDAALAGLSAADWRRARRWAERCAHNLPGWTGEDLLQEAMCKFLTGERVWQRSVKPFVALASVVRSISSNIRKSGAAQIIDQNAVVDTIGSDGAASEGSSSVAAVDRRSPDRIVEAKDDLVEIAESLEGDEGVELVAMAWMDELRGKEAAEAAGLDMKTYDAARKRLLRKLDECGKLGRIA